MGIGFEMQKQNKECKEKSYFISSGGKIMILLGFFSAVENSFFFKLFTEAEVQASSKNGSNGMLGKIVDDLTR